MKKPLIAAALIAAAGWALAQDVMKVDAMKVVKPDTLTWRDNPNFPKGAQVVVLVGDPTKAGVFITRSKFPPTVTIKFRRTLIPFPTLSPSLPVA